MSHAVESIAYLGETPWHGIGYRIDEQVSPVKMMELAKLDWEVAKVPAFINIDGTQIETGSSALVRLSDKKILDTIPDKWLPTQNAEAFEFFDDFCKEGHMTMETAGSLNGGRNVFVLAKVQSSFEAVRGDRVDAYLLFSNPHRYGRAITIRFTPIRVVCQNTLSLALSTRGKQDMSVSINHRKVFNAEEVKTTLKIATTKLDTYAEASKFLASKRFTKESLATYINDVFPKTVAGGAISDNDNKEISRPARDVLAIVDSQPGAQFGEGSWWHAFNSITYYTNHIAGRSVDTRLQSAWFGANKDRNLKALDKAIQYAKAA